MQFIGEYEHNIDDKNRLAVPKKFRQLLKQGAVVTRGLDNCLFLYPLTEWKKLLAKLGDLPLSQSKSRAFSRLMLAGAMEVTLDKQGRVLIPDYLRSFAKLGKSSIVIGMLNRAEIWNKESWNTYKAATEKDSVSIAETLSELGI